MKIEKTRIQFLGDVFVVVAVFASSTATVTETSVYKCVRVVSKLIALIPSRSIRQMLANFSGLEFFKTVSNFRKRKKIAVVCSSSPKRETRHFHVVVVQ